jgi:C1A family cysteine protease
MHHLFVFLATLLAVIVASNANPVSSNSLPSRYQVSGIILLPYAEIHEPFESWIDVDAGFSRIDYYGGAAKTVQRKGRGAQDFGANYKIVPMSDEQVLNKISCFQSNGSQQDLVDVQHTIPDLSTFKNLGPGDWRGIKCQVYQTIDQVGEKKSTYTYYVNAENNHPVHYEMFGYDTLIGSHFDKYTIDYFGYNEDPIDPAIFHVTDAMQCTGFPGPGLEHTSPRVLFNPMSEYINRHGEEHFESSFEEFKKKHGYQYDTEHEHRHRMKVFRNNVRYVNTRNRASLPYKMRINKFADRTDDELRVLRGKHYTEGYNGGLPFPKELKSGIQAIPDTIDWRIMGAVTPVKDQGICGSCWSFGTTGTIEGAYFVKHGTIVRLSEQNLIDCSWGFGNNGCDGGEDFRAYQYIMKHGGIALEDAYGSYLQEDSFCHYDNTTIGAKILGYVNITQGDEEALRIAIATKGPISVSIDAAHKGFLFYSNGVFYDPECGNTPDALDHSVLAVGYGTLNGQDYWLIKNSWSTYWGNDGYVLISRKNNNCGVATAATYVMVE